MATVDVAGLCKSYGSQPVLHDLDLQVGEGEFVTLLGPSGCGKTTTLRCLAGLERADGGTIRIGEQVVASAGGVYLPPNRRDIGMVFQSYALWPHMTVFSNVAYPLRMRRAGRTDRRARVMEILATVGMERLAQRQVTELSGGQQQRVALARAMVADPGLLLFDEPLSNLDAKLRKSMRREIATAHSRSGASSIYVTHDQEEAIVLSDRIVLLRDGVVQQIGSPREIYREPANVFVADFVGFDNVLLAQVDGHRDGACGLHLPETSAVIWAERGTATATAGSPAGSAAALAVRAENMSLRARADRGELGPNEATARVISSSYTGQHSEYVLELAGQSLIVRESDERDEPLAPGSEAIVHFDPAHCVALRGLDQPGQSGQPSSTTAPSGPARPPAGQAQDTEEITA